MKTFAVLTTLSALASAATVTLQETPCLQETRLEKFTIDLDKLVVKKLESVCGLKLVSASGADINAITCQAYIDAAGTRKGSAEFTFAVSAQIATNPVQEGAIRCNSTGAAAGGVGSGTGKKTGINADPAAPTGTGASSLMPSSTSNGTISLTGPSRTPTASDSGSPTTPSTKPSGAAGQVGAGVGAVVAGMGFAVLLL